MTTADIHLTRWGGGPRVVMVHGGAQGGPAGGEHQFAAQRPLADQGWELVLPDRPGHGRSPSRGPEDLELEAKWVAELVGPGAHLVGHSYGGAIALCAAMLRPFATRSLTLIEAPILSVAADHPDVRAFRAQIEAAIAPEDPIAVMISFSQVAGIPVELLKPTPGPEQLARMGEGLRQMRPPYTWNASAAIGTVAAACIPVLVVTGGWNPAFEVIADELVRRLSAQRLLIDAGHHFPHLVAGGTGNVAGSEFNDTIHDFLGTSQVPGRRGAASAREK
jgi:pimeloyl-ACP methyl ester carboxylesterase